MNSFCWKCILFSYRRSEELLVSLQWVIVTSSTLPWSHQQHPCIQDCVACKVQWLLGRSSSTWSPSREKGHSNGLSVSPWSLHWRLMKGSRNTANLKAAPKCLHCSLPQQPELGNTTLTWFGLHLVLSSLKNKGQLLMACSATACMDFAPTHALHFVSLCIHGLSSKGGIGTQRGTWHFLPESPKCFVFFETDSATTVPRGKLVFFQSKNHSKGRLLFLWENDGVPLGKTEYKPKWKFSFYFKTPAWNRIFAFLFSNSRYVFPIKMFIKTLCFGRRRGCLILLIGKADLWPSLNIWKCFELFPAYIDISERWKLHSSSQQISSILWVIQFIESFPAQEITSLHVTPAETKTVL